MRNILKNTGEVMHYWANQVQASGSCGNVSFDASRIYSYRACIGRILPNNMVAITTQTYSVTTSKHVSGIRSAARHLKIVRCNDPSASARENQEYAMRGIDSALANAQLPRIKQATRDAYKATALHLAESFNQYLAALPASEHQSILPIDTVGLESARAAMVAALVKKDLDAKAAHKAREALAKKSTAELLALWRTGDYVDGNRLRYIPCALRINADTIQTSHGADIPIEAAHMLWPVIQDVMADGVDVETSGNVAIGHYRLTKIRADGSIVVGCHDIAYSEIEGIAQALGLATVTTA